MGHNIEFVLLHDGKKVLASGVRAGVATGTASVEPGTVSVVLMNDNILQQKNGRLSIRIVPE
jgi:hypothetical protein